MGVEGIEYGRERERLEQLLRSVDRPGDYCVGGRLYTPMPRVIVDGAGELSFPMPEAQIEALIRAAERAPYGKGTETLVDTSTASASTSTTSLASSSLDRLPVHSRSPHTPASPCVEPHSSTERSGRREIGSASSCPTPARLPGTGGSLSLPGM